MSFSKEKDWRILSNLMLNRKLRPKFRSRTFMLIPYYTFELKNDDLNFQIKEIIIGPTAYEELSKTLVEFLLKSNSIRGCNVKISEIPFNR